MMALPEGRVPTLVQYCQRVAVVHVDAISSLGELRYDLVKPILERCNKDQLCRLEDASPHLSRDTQEIWRQLCFRTYPVAAERHHRDEMEEPESWRDQYFVLVEEEARRIEEVGNKLRRQRQEADERKKEQEIKITTQLPSAKRRWGVSAQPRTLFQKTRTEVSKLQKNVYGKPMLPPMPSGKTYRVLPPNDSALLPGSHPGGPSSRVSVTTVTHRVPASGSASVSTSRMSKPSMDPSFHTSTPATSRATTSSLPNKNSSVSQASPSKPPPPKSPPSATIPPLQKTAEPPRKKARLTSPEISPMSPPRPPKPPISKRDPMASLFMPKHRAYSQRIN